MEYRIEKWEGPGEPDTASLVRQMRSEGYSVFQWTDNAGTVYPDHQHPEDQSHWIISGMLELTVLGYGKATLGPGDRDFMPVGTMHSAKVIGGQPVKYLIGARN